VGPRSDAVLLGGWGVWVDRVTRPSINLGAFGSLPVDVVWSISSPCSCLLSENGEWSGGAPIPIIVSRAAR